MSDSALVKQDVQQLYRQLVKQLELTPRWGQKQMIATVANHILAISRSEDGHRIDDNPVCLVEAGTGTGKTLAYMVACLPIAKALDKISYLHRHHRFARADRAKRSTCP